MKKKRKLKKNNVKKDDRYIIKYKLRNIPTKKIKILLGRENGYVDILGEQTYSTVKSDFTGVIESIDPINGLVINTNVVAIDGVVSSN